METVDVEDEIDKAMELAVEELGRDLVQIASGIIEDEFGFWRAEKQFSAAIVSFACRLLPVLLKLYDHRAKYVEHEGSTWRRTRCEPATYRSMWGEIEVERSVYLQRGASGGEQLVPLEHQAGLVDETWTPHCAEAMGRMVQSVPPREAEENMQTVGVLNYSRSSFDRVARQMGQIWEENRPELEGELIDTVDVPDEAAAISVAFDRVRIEMDETDLDPDQWPNGRKQPRTINGRMAYCATVTLHDRDGEPLWTNRYGRVANQPPDQDVPGAGEWIIREQVRADVDALLDEKPSLAERAVVLTDGGPELERIADEDFPDWPSLCDMRHLDTYLADALEATDLSKDERTQRRERWKRKLKEEDDAIDSIEDELRWWEDAPAVDAALTYIDNRRERMNYAQARRQNLPVASGHVEATCKSLVQVRMRRSGQRWTKPSARTILNLRTLALSDTWTEGVELLTDKLVDDNLERHDALCQRYAA